MRQKMEFSIEALEEAKERLMALPEKKKERFTTQEAVEFLYDEVQNALQKKYDIKEIFAIIRESGCGFSEKSLKYFSDIFNKIDAERAKTNKPKRKKDVAPEKKEAQKAEDKNLHSAPNAPQPDDNNAEFKAQDLAQHENNGAEEQRQLGSVHGNHEAESRAQDSQLVQDTAESAQKDHPNTGERKKKKKEQKKVTDEPNTAELTPKPEDETAKTEAQHSIQGPDDAQLGTRDAENERRSGDDKAESGRQDDQDKDVEEKNKKGNNAHFELEPDTEDL